MQHVIRSFVRPLAIAGLLTGFVVALSAAGPSSRPSSAAPATRPAPGPSGPRIGYNRDIRPILSDNCFACHGPDKNKRKAKLRLDERDSALAKKAIVPGDVEASELVSRIFSDDPDEQMPPPESHKKLTDAQKELFKRWVAQGAVYEPHWSYIVPKRAPVPQAKDAGWGRNPVDAFILQKLEEKHLAPSREADRRTLLRRLSLDLVGLPPTPEEVEAFVKDDSPEAYERQVERLLASPHYGERMAVPWLDAVRFADTVGFHGDQNQDVFPYRDYVIEAFNRNKPFDRFTVEQLAGDLLPHPTTEQLVATCFNRLNMVTREGGAQPKEYLAKYAADRVRTVGNAWLGSTLMCCECHDHKYDPFTARDFYSLGAFFADVKQWGVYHDYNYTPNPDLRGWSNEHPFPPAIVVDSPYLQRRQARLTAQIEQTIATASQRLAKDSKAGEQFAQWRADVQTFLKAHPDGWAVAAPVEVGAATAKPKAAAPRAKAGAGAPKPANVAKAKVPTAAGESKATVLENDTVLFTGKVADDRIEFDIPPGRIAAVRLELLPREENRGGIVRGGAESAMVQVSAALKKAGGAERALGVFYADAELKDERYANGYAILGVKDGWKTSSEYPKGRQTAVYLLDKPITATEGDRLVILLPKNMAGCLRVSVSPVAPLKPIDAGFVEALGRATSAGAGAITPVDRGLLEQTYLLSTGWDEMALADVRRLYRQVLECRDGKSPVLVTVAWEPRVARILARGNWQDESGEIVQPAPPRFLAPDASPAAGGRRLTRLDLANWIVSPDNPLTARVFVNRLWKQFLGAGLCNSVEDLGAQGEPASHPELLDWLAVEFRESGWDIKHVVRLIVTSAAYRQDSNLRPELKDVDPANRLLASQNPRRLEAEFVRDNALGVAGLIDLDLGGPSAKPYQPEGYYANIQFPDRPYVPEADERQYRRGLYVHWQRTFLHPMLANFDAPSREDSICTRNVSNTPQQALTLMNDPTFVEAARVLAQQAMNSGARDDAQRIGWIYRRVLSRAIKANERESLTKFLATQRDCYKADPAGAKKLVHLGFAPVDGKLDEVELASWMTVCRVVLNLHETITRY